MPEGDTIHNAAARLRPALEGAVLQRCEARRLVGDRPRPGEEIERVAAVGKHLTVRFSGGLTLDTHMRMTGSWHLHATGERWRTPAHLARCVLVVPGWQAVCSAAPVVRTFPTSRTGTADDPLAHLGPDLCLRSSAEPHVVAACVARMDLTDPSTTIASVLLDQRIGNGIGNVYASEVCWFGRVDPRTPVAEVPTALRRHLIVTAGELLRANLGRSRRRTVPDGLAVYGRRGRPCPRCNTPVRAASTGDHARATYWCPRCQPRGGRSSGT